MPHVPHKPPCGIEINSPCPPYIRTWRRNTVDPLEYRQFVPGAVGGVSCDDEEKCRFAIYVGNENAIPDDDMDVSLNGVKLLTIFEADPNADCEQTYCRGHLILPASVAALAPPTIIGGGGAGLGFCAGQPIDLRYHYHAALDAVPIGLNIAGLKTALFGSNNCNNFGRFRIYQVCVQRGNIVLQAVTESLYSGSPLDTDLKFDGECKRSRRPPAKGVKLHVLIPKVDTTIEADGLVKKIATDVASYVLYFDSHGKLDHVEFACPKVKLTTATDLSCSSCAGSSGSEQLLFAPGIFYELTCDELGRACPILTCCQE